MNIVFIGTPDFAVPCLEKLIKSENCNVLAVFTQPDKRSEENSLTPPPVKVLAVQHNIPVYQPVTLKMKMLLKPLKVESGFDGCCCLWQNITKAYSGLSEIWMY